MLNDGYVHNNVLEILDNYNDSRVGIYKSFGYKTEAIMEFYVAKNSVDGDFEMEFNSEGSIPIATFAISSADGHFKLNGNDCMHPDANTFYRIQLGFRKASGSSALPAPFNTLAAGKCRVYINDVAYGDWNVSADPVTANYIDFEYTRLHASATSKVWIDAIGVVGESGYAQGDNLSYAINDNITSYCTWGIIHQIIEDSAWVRFISTKVIYEGDLILIYDENAIQLFYGKVVQAKDLGGVSTYHTYEYECWGLEYSDLGDDVAVDYSTVATDCATIAIAAIDDVKTYITDDATSIPATTITCKPKWNQTPLNEALTDLAWRCNGIWYALNSSGKIYFRKTSNLVASGITLPATVKHKIWECQKNTEFINSVILTCSNGLTSVAAQDAASIAQYNQRNWSAKKFFVEFYDQTEINSMATAILNADKIKTPDAVKRCVIDIYEQIGIQVGTTISVTSTNFDALATAKTLIIVEAEHDLKINHTKIWCTENILRLETQKDYYNEKISALEESAVNQGGDLKSNYIFPLRIVPQHLTTAGANNVYWSYENILHGTNSFDSNAYLVAFFRLPSHYVAGSNFKIHFNQMPNGAGAKTVKYKVEIYRHADGAANSLEQTINTGSPIAETGNANNYKSVTVTATTNFLPSDYFVALIYASDNAEGVTISTNEVCLELL